MNQTNITGPSLAAGSVPEQQNPANSTQDSNDYFYILIVMSFYGIFLTGIMLGYMKSKRKEKNNNLLLFYKDEEKGWDESTKFLPTVFGRRSAPMPMMLNVLQERMGPALSCAICSMEASSVSSDSSSPDVHFTIQEEVLDGDVGDGSDLLNDSGEGSSANINPTS
ncbi:potassium voltage-gated channel subfamily E member 4-like [Rhinatrema bivittatum]|uniref:potassium voltage-gated channel subfamily E member 4-like n=1 Tax=Rhinatrema bivittatum TaxID=194408 RepID=UPI001125CDF0|nr:potassium voltage-gated channel subfamily E member 4-like [Rhinatrema bivittatum]XP_029472792.1 potassium voltage-gated channel subfamily E member 4-like [Rhinatrema bivittatum]